MLPSDFCLPPAKLLGFAHFTSVVRIVGLSISPSFTIPGVQAWPVPAVDARQSDKPFIQRLKATIIPIGNTLTTKELADSSQASFLLCLCPTAGVKPFRDLLFPNGRVQAPAWSHFPTCIQFSVDKSKQNLRHISNHSTCEMEGHESHLGLSIHIRTAMVTECGLWDGSQGNIASISEIMY
jgi:hypothetical protein